MVIFSKTKNDVFDEQNHYGCIKYQGSIVFFFEGRRKFREFMQGSKSFPSSIRHNFLHFWKPEVTQYYFLHFLWKWSGWISTLFGSNSVISKKYGPFLIMTSLWKIQFLKIFNIIVGIFFNSSFDWIIDTEKH